MKVRRASAFVFVRWFISVYSRSAQEDVLPAVRVAHAQLPDDPVLRWKTVIPVVGELKAKAKSLGLWNLFLSKAHYPNHGVPLTNLEVSSSSELGHSRA